MWIFLTSIFLFIFVGISQGQIACLESYNKKNNILNENELLLDNKLYAVHLTDYFPKENVLRTDSKKSFRFAPTLHFSLGGTVKSHSAGNWDTKKYAVLLPLKFLKPQMLNLFNQDTFILGDLNLPKESLLFIPVGETLQNNFHGKIIYYDSRVTLSEAVSKYLQEIGSVVLKSAGPYLSDKVTLEEKEIVETVFFESYFKSKKILTHNLHSETVFGQLQIEVHNFFANWLYRKKPTDLNLYEVRYHKLIFEEQLSYVTAISHQLQLPEVAKKSFNKHVKELRKLLNIIDAEILLQEKYQRSFFATVEPFQTEILKKASTQEELFRYIGDNYTSFPEKPPSIYGKNNFIKMSVQDLHFLSFEDYQKIVYSELQKMEITDDFFYKYLLLKKALSLIPKDTKYTKLSKDLFEKAFSTSSEEKQLYHLVSLLREMIPTNEVNSFFQSESVKQKYNQYFSRR